MRETIKALFSWVADNREWVFSGIGVAILAVAWRILRRVTQKRPSAQQPPPPSASVFDQRNQQVETQTDIAGSQIAAGRDVLHAGRDINIIQSLLPPLQRLHQIPPPSVTFTGREKELAQLRRVFEHPGRVLEPPGDAARGVAISGIRGMGGIGKTELAKAVAHELRDRYPDAQILVALKGAHPKGEQALSPSEALAHVARSFHPDAKLPEKQEELRALYYSMLEGKRAFLLLDNALDAAQIAPLLPPPPGCAVVVTSRWSFSVPGLEPLNLDTLDPEEARDLLLRIAPRIGNHAEEIAQLCGCLPLALCLAAGALAARENLAPGDYIRQLRAGKARLAALDRYRGATEQELGVEASLDMSYEWLGEDLRKLWRALAVFPGTFDAAGAAAVWGMPPAPLGVLEPFGVLEPCSSLVAGSHASRLPSQPPSASTAGEEQGTSIVGGKQAASVAGEEQGTSIVGGKQDASVAGEEQGTSIVGGKQAASAAGEEQGTSIVGGKQAASVAGEKQGASMACAVQSISGAEERLGDLLACHTVQWNKETGRYSLHDLARDYAAARLSGEERAEAERRHAAHYCPVLAQAQILYLKGGDGVLQGLALFDWEWENIRTGQAWAAVHAGDDETATRLSMEYSYAGAYCLGLRLHPREQIAWLESSLAAARKLGDRAQEGNALGSLGNAYAHLGDPRRAIEFYEQALAIHRETCDRWRESATFDNLGNAYLSLGDPRRAIEFYEQRLALAREVGDRRGEGNAFGNLGNAYIVLSETRRAIEYHEQALAIEREVGDRHEEGNSLGNLGIAYHDLGDPHRAIGLYEQHLAIAREIGDRQGEGAALGNLGNAYADLGDPHRAIEFHEQYLAIARKIGDRRGEGNALFNRALALDDLGRRDEAIASARDALAIFEQIEDPNAAKVRRQLQDWGALPR